MVKHSSLNPKARFLKKDIVAAFTANRSTRRKSAPAFKLRRCQTFAIIKLVNFDTQVAGVASDEVPWVGGKLKRDGVDKPAVAVDAYYLIAPEHEPEQVIEADEMIHMPVADEHVGNAQQFSRGQRRQVAEIE